MSGFRQQDLFSRRLTSIQPKTSECGSETDLSTLEAGAQAAPWLSRTDSNEGRPQGHYPPARARPQAPVGLTGRGETPLMPTGAHALAEPVAHVAPVERLRRRADFLRAARTGRKVAMRSLVLQARRRDESETGTPQHDPVRIGFTVSRKVGNAVERNRVRRRLREAVRMRAGSLVRSGHDYVVIGRRAALTTPFARILTDLETALRKIHGSKAHGRTPNETPHDKAPDQ